MNPLIIIYMIVSIIFALFALSYVVVDIIIEVINKNREEEETTETPEPVVEKIEEVPEPEPEPEPEIVEHITPEEADEMMTNSMAIKKALYESGAGHGKQGIINIGVIDENFEAGDVVTLAVLKEKKLVPKNVGRLKILAHGMLNKPLTIKSESYSVQTMKMVELTGGTVIILKD